MIPWQQLNPFRNHTFPLLTGGRELFGTVIRYGKMDKTVTVKCDFKHWNGYASKVMHSSSKFLAHDQDNFLVAGDKVIICYAGAKISPKKHYYVRNIVQPFPRLEVNSNQPKPVSALSTLFKQEYASIISQDQKQIRSTEQKTKFKKAAKAKAMAKAVQKLNIIEKSQANKDINLDIDQVQKTANINQMKEN